MIGFDNASLAVHSQPFEERYTSLLLSVSLLHPTIIVASRVSIKDGRHRERWMEEIVKDEGEGLIARSPSSPYVHGRSNLLVKIKAVRGDKEALVTNSTPHLTTFRMANGILFKVETKQINLNIQQGDVVSFSFQKITKFDEPINPIITRIRTDIKWEDVLNSYEEDLHNNKKYEKDNKIEKTFLKKDKMRGFFIDVLRKQNLDPLVSSNWYLISPSIVRSIKGAKPMLRKFKGSVIQAILQLFPELNLIADKFSFLPQFFWKDVNKRRKLFDTLAKALGIDPLVATNWYPYRIEDFKIKGVKPILNYYYGSNLGKALTHLYPDVEFDISKFLVSSAKKKNLKSLLDNFAKQHNFEPLVASNWYQITEKQFTNSEAIRYILTRCPDMITALKEAYPDVHFEPRLFPFNSNSVPSEEEQRSFFMEFARDNEFDPLVADHWYSFTYQSIRSAKGSRKVLQPYQGNWRKALLNVFPNIGLEDSKFLFTKINWGDLNAQQKWFAEFAKHHNFNPHQASNWYSVQMSDIMNYKLPGIQSIVTQYNGSLADALMHVFPNVGLDKRKLFVYPAEYWDNNENRRKTIHEFCEKYGFSVSDKLALKYFTKFKFSDTQNGKQLLSKYKNDLVAALYNTFPDLFELKERHNKIVYWQNEDNRRDFFEEFAREMNFDPKRSDNWTSSMQSKLKQKKNASSVLAYYHGSVTKAICTLFN